MRWKFPRGNRISRRTEISAILRNGKRCEGAKLSIAYSPNTLCHDRMAVLVGRKHGNAVQRNALKRACREIFRQYQGISRSFYDIVFRPRYECVAKAKDLKVEYENWRDSLNH